MEGEAAARCDFFKTAGLCLSVGVLSLWGQAEESSGLQEGIQAERSQRRSSGSKP